MTRRGLERLRQQGALPMRLALSLLGGTVPEEPEMDALVKERSVVDEEPRDDASESADPDGLEPLPEPTGEIEEQQSADAVGVFGTEKPLETFDEADGELETGEQVEPLTDAEYGDRVREVAAKLDDEVDGGRYVPEAVIRSNEDPEWGSANRKTFDCVKDKFDGWSIYDDSVDGRAPVLVDSSN